MPESTEYPSELFLRFTRRNMKALLFVVIILGGAALSLMLSGPGMIRRAENLQWWLLPIFVALFVAIPVSLQARRWRPDSPEVKMVMEDEFRRTNMDRASRVSLIVVLLAQWPLVFLFGFLRPDLPQPRSSMAMAAATIVLGLVTLISLFLYLDRE